MKCSLLVVSLLFPWLTFAEVSISKMELENQIQKRVSDVVNKVDKMAIVHVEVKIKRIASQLSFIGVNARSTPLEFGGSLGSESLESISVKVVSQLDELPNWVKEEAVKAASFEKIPVRFHAEKAAGPIPDLEFQVHNKVDQVLSRVVEYFGSVKWVIFGMAILFAGCFLLLGWSIRSISGRIEQSLARVIEDKLIPSLNSLQTSQPLPRRDFSDSPSSKNSSQSFESNSTQLKSSAFEALPKEAIESLFLDCYWTRNDGYANYIWSELNPKQRQDLLQSKQLDRAYFSFLRNVPSAVSSYHLDAWYLSSENIFSELDENDLMQTLDKKPEYFSLLSPMRSDFLPLRLEERLKLSLMEPVDPKKVSPMQFKASAKREFPPQIQVNKVSLEDESYMYRHPETIPWNLKTQISSLVWLAMCPDEYIKDILNQLDARQLAVAWSGPEEVLSKFRSMLNDKKWDTISHTLKTQVPDRNSEEFAYLVSEGLKGLADHTEPQKELLAA